MAGVRRTPKQVAQDNLDKAKERVARTADNLAKAQEAVAKASQDHSRARSNADYLARHPDLQESVEGLEQN